MPDALAEARRRERISHAQWRQRRAEVARLVAAGEDAAARALLEQAGTEPQPSPAWEAPPDVDTAPPAAPAPKLESASGDASHRANKPKHKPKPTRVAAQRTTARVRARQRQRPRRRLAKRTWAVWLRERPPWVMSLATHGALIAMFGLLTFGTLGDPGFTLSVSLDDEDAWNETLAEVVVTDLDQPSELAEPLDNPIDLAADLDLASLVEPVSFEPVTDVGAFSALSAESLMEAVPSGATSGDGDSQGTPAGGGSPRTGAPGKVSFFGSKADAERVIFVVDNSGSMQRGRMETTLLELDRAVQRLSFSQEFYVVFFSDQAYPMFFPVAAEAPIPATRENKRRLTAWLHTVEICLGGRLLDAMEIAAGLEPDLVYLLTDGDIRSERIIGALTTKDGWSFPIHTLGMGARTTQHVALLRAIATNSGGDFRPVAAHPAAVARSRLKPIPYHRTPGKVWGSAVQAWD